ncbi:hypothetical protein [Streptomyces sp. NPDC049879]|uniref:hypothetical protein n=1 Tax=Streptomyces sp. NPDC049879 TaxID=3365598 RepID=UPI00379A8FAA
MGQELVLAGVSGLVALAGVLLSARTARRQSVLTARMEDERARRARSEERSDLMALHRDPLLWAAFELQSRLYNMVVQEFGPYTDRTREYALRSTLFVFAQYFCCVEMLRRRIQFLDLGDRADNRRIMQLISRIDGLVGAYDVEDARQLVVFRHEQRGIGEVMVVEDGGDGGGQRCMGYAEFSSRLGDPEFARWMRPLADYWALWADGTAARDKLVALQHHLMDLIDFLDPGIDRFPDARRSRVPSPEG